MLTELPAGPPRVPPGRDHTYLITSRVGRHPIELKERLERAPYEYKPGDVDYKRCASCGIPLGAAPGW